MMFGEGGVRRADVDCTPPPPIEGCNESTDGRDVGPDGADVGDESGYLVAEQDRDGPVRRVFWCLTLLLLLLFCMISFKGPLLLLLLPLLLMLLMLLFEVELAFPDPTNT